MQFHSQIDSFLDPAFKWKGEPGKEGNDGSYDIRKGASATGMLITPAPYRDFWSKTFYEPVLKKSDGQAFLATVNANSEVTMDLAFSYTPKNQFDQAIAFVYVDDNTWVKAGVEFCDGSASLSVVVCNDGFADWSTRPLMHSAWDSDKQIASVRLRVHKLRMPGSDQGPCVVVEAAPYSVYHHGPDADPGQFSFIRIASLRSGEKPWQMGPACFVPLEQKGCTATFHYIRIGPPLPLMHSADPGL